MRRILLVCGLSAVFGWASVAQEIVTVGVFLHDPYVVSGNGGKEVRGAGIDYVTSVLKEMNCIPRFVVMPFSRVIGSLQAGTIDMSFDLTKNAEREEFAYFSDKPVMKVSPAFFVRTDSKISAISSVNDLKGLTIGAVQGIIIPKFLDVPDIFRFDYTSGEDGIKQNLKKLLGRRFDIAIDLNPYSMMAEARKLGLNDKLRVIPMPGDATNFYVLFSKKANNSIALLAKFNQASASGKFDYSRIIENSLK